LYSSGQSGLGISNAHFNLLISLSSNASNQVSGNFQTDAVFSVYISRVIDDML
jgi:hypothetical protein